MSELNTMIDVSRQFEVPRQQASIAQDNQAKAAFTLRIMQQMPQQPAKPEEPPRIPSLGALAIPS